MVGGEDGAEAGVGTGAGEDSRITCGGVIAGAKQQQVRRGEEREAAQGGGELRHGAGLRVSGGRRLREHARRQVPAPPPRRRNQAGGQTEPRGTLLHVKGASIVSSCSVKI